MTDSPYVSPFVPLQGLEGKYDMDDVVYALRSVQGGKVFKANGMEGASGWELLSEMRGKLALERASGRLPKMSFVTIVTHTLKLRFLSEQEKVAGIDLIQVKGGNIFFWWELGLNKNAVVSERVSMRGCQWLMYDIEGLRTVLVFVACDAKEASSLKEQARKADYLEVSGLLVDASGAKSKQDLHMVATNIVPKSEDLSSANDVLKHLVSWRDISPAVDVKTGDPLFPDEVALSMMFSTMYYREGTPALNVIFFGPANSGKTQCLKFQAVKMVGGSLPQGGAGASGKMWLVTHKDGVESKILTETRVLFVDEFFKAASSSGRGNMHTYALELKEFLVKHMQILEKSDLEFSSGAGTISGKMKCAFVGTENDDLSLMRALARADSLSEGPMRRIQFAYVDGPESDKYVVRADPGEVERKMLARMYAKFGKNALKGMNALYAYSRRFMSGTSFDAPDWWMEQTMECLDLEFRSSADWVPKEFYPGMDPERARMLTAKVRGYINQHQPAMRACWVCAAVLRGWELSDGLETLEPVEDLEQQKRAEQVARFLFISKLRVFAPGMEDVVRIPASISRVSWYDGGR